MTIRPYPDFRPVLTLGDATDSDAALFRLHDGRLRLENLHFVLPLPRFFFAAGFFTGGSFFATAFFLGAAGFFTGFLNCYGLGTSSF